MAQVVQCPNCRSTNVVKTTTGKVTERAAAFGAGMVVGVTKVAANNLLFEGAGRLIPNFSQSLASLAPVEYVCHACDCLFKTTFSADGEIKETSLKKLPMPEKIIEQVRTKYIQTIRKERPFISAVIFGLLALYGLIYVFIGIANDSFWAAGVQIVLGFCTWVIFSIPAVIKWRKISLLNQEIDKSERQSLRKFKHSHRELFTQYSQYN